MSGFVIQWEGLNGQVVPEEEQSGVHPHEARTVFRDEQSALREIVEDADAAIAEARSTRRTAMKRLRALRRAALSTPQATDSGVDLDPPMKRI